MNTLQINKILNRNNITKYYYIGCFPSDSIPNPINFKIFCMVVNTDTSREAGSHWVAIFCQYPLVDYYDSLGIWPPISLHIRNYLSLFQSVRFNRIQIQHPFQYTCGQHVIFFLFLRCKGLHMDKIIKYLKGVDADKLVSEFVSTKIFSINS